MCTEAMISDKEVGTKAGASDHLKIHRGSGPRQRGRQDLQHLSSQKKNSLGLSKSHTVSPRPQQTVQKHLQFVTQEIQLKQVPWSAL